MKKRIRSLAYLFLMAFLSHIAIFAHTKSATLKLESNIYSISNNAHCFVPILVKNSGNWNESLAPPAPPLGIYDRYYCINDAAVPLTATGTNLKWYTSATGTTFSSTPPTPSTSLKGTTPYYVSQTVGGEESARALINVNVDKQFDLFCAGVTPNSVSFDFANVGQSRFDYSYTVNGVGPITGSQTSPSSLTIYGLSEGQTVVLTVTAIGAPSCVLNPKLIASCKTRCTSAPEPNFGSTPTSYCIDEATTELPTDSDDSPAITGTWFPAKVNTATAETSDYVFTPDPLLFPCALPITLTMTVGPAEPDFTDFSICSGEPAPDLSSTSPNGITGTWMPSSIDNMNSASYDFTPDPGQACAPIGKTINITVNPSNSILSVNWTVTDAFADNQKVTVTDPLGANYLYQLDDGPFQEEAVFEMVSLGMHSLTVKDVDGCSELRNNNVLVIDYPKFFTPNNDGYNDMWNIFTLGDELGAKIQIFDRYGKLLKEIDPNSSGWNGTFNGRPLPATDYWFVVDYPEDGIIKKFRSHFSLKR